MPHEGTYDASRVHDGAFPSLNVELHCSFFKCDSRVTIYLEVPILNYLYDGFHECHT